MSSINNETSVHPSAVGNTDPSRPSIPSGNEEYPEMHHAGKVGYGPNYHHGPTTADKVTGLKEEVFGKIKRSPELVQHGKDLKSGDLARKEKEADDAENPFAKQEEDQSTTSIDASSPRTTTTTESTNSS